MGTGKEKVGRVEEQLYKLITQKCSCKWGGNAEEKERKKEKKKDIKKNQTPNTPNIVAFLALNEALKEIIEEKRITRYYELSNYLRDEFIKMNLKFVINRELMSNTVTNIIMPPSISAKQMYESLLAKGYVTYLGKSSDVLQVAVMGNVTKLDCSELIKEMNKIITKKEL